MRTFFLVSLLLAAGCLAGIAQETSTPSSGPDIPEARNDWEKKAEQNNDVARRMGKRIGLVFDGDAITYDWLTTGRVTWNECFAKAGAFSFGAVGDRTQNVLWRQAHGQMDGVSPKLILLLIGTQNLTAGNSAEDTAAGVSAVVAEYRRLCPEATILVQGLFPRGQKADAPVRAQIRAVNELIAKLADGDKVLYMDFGEKFLNADGSISPDIMPDSVGLSPKGYVIWADAIQPVVDKVLAVPITGR